MSTAPSASQTPTAAGWYPDPTWPTQLRYFDGLEWTRQIMAPSRTPQLLSMWPDTKAIAVWAGAVAFVIIIQRIFF